MLNQHHNDIICVNETWLRPDHHIPLIENNDTHAIIRCDRKDRNGGGVLMAIPFNVQFHFISAVACQAYEAITVRFPLIDTVVTCLYRPPSAAHFELLRNLINDQESRWLLIGDFNFPNINWKTGQCKGSEITTEFVKCVTLNGLNQLVDFPTRQLNTLDLVLTNDSSLIASVSPAPNFSTSDHCSIEIRLTTNVTNCHRIKKSLQRDWSHCNYAELDFCLLTSNWDLLFANCASLQHHVDTFYDYLNFLLDHFAPFRSLASISRLHKSKTIRKLEKEKQNIHKRLRHQYNATDATAFKSIALQIRQCLFRSQSEEEKRILSSGSTKACWAYVRKRAGNTKRSSRRLVLLRADNTLIDDSVEKASVLNSHYQAVFTDPHAVYTQPTNPSLPRMKSRITIEEKDVWKLLSRQPSKLSCGPDNITQRLLKKCALGLAYPVSKIFRLSLLAASCPRQFKCATIVPIPKCENPTQAVHYRPVSLTSVFCRCMEQILRIHILKHLNSNNAISMDQHGFLPHRSPTTQLITCLSDWSSMLDNGLPVDIIYFDFQKAFDRVSHALLLDKLSIAGLSHEIISWIKDFLHDRIQRVRVDDKLSPALSVYSGVPQGSSLGPLLFTIFINDCVQAVKHSSVKLFADDVKIYRSVTNQHDAKLLQEDISAIVQWSESNLMPLAPSKTMVLHMGVSNAKFPYQVNQTIINSTDQVNDLGVIIDSKLSFRPHITTVARKASNVCWSLRRSFANNTANFQKNLYTTFVRPHVEYAAQVWNPVQHSLSNIIEKVQRRFTKSIEQLHHLDYESRLRAIELESLHDRRNIHDLILIWKVFNFKLPIPLPLPTADRRSSRRGHQLKLEHPEARLHNVSKQWPYRCANKWNHLPSEIATANTIGIFKQKLKNYLAVHGTS